MSSSHCAPLTVPRSARVMNKAWNARNFIIADLRAGLAPALRENVPETETQTNKNGTRPKIENDFLGASGTETIPNLNFD